MVDLEMVDNRDSCYVMVFESAFVSFAENAAG